MDISNVINSISGPRLSFYEAFLGCSTEQEKVGAYVAYQDLSGDFFCVMQMIEVALRNAINNTVKLHVGSSSWYDTIPFSTQSKQLVQSAKDKAIAECGVRYSDDDVISRLTFGFWVYMLDAPYRDTSKSSYIWTPENRNLTFPVAKNPWGADMKINALFDDFHKVLLFRNRLFHHEPIWKKHGCKSHQTAVDNVRKDFDFLMKVLGYVSVAKVDLLRLIGHDQKFYARCDIKHIQEVMAKIPNPSTTLNA